MILASLQARIIGGFALVILLTLVVAGVVFFSLLGGYRQAIDRNALIPLADQVTFGLSQFAARNLPPDALASYVAVQSEETGVLVFILDSSGRVVQDLSPASEYERLQLPVTLADVRRSPTRYVEGEVDTGDGRISFLARMLPVRPSQRGSFVAIALPDTATSDIIGDLTPRLLLSGLIGLAVALVVAFWVSRSIYNPLERVTAAVRAVGGGRYETRVPESGTVEVRDLARAFNRMTTQVQTNQETLQNFMADVSHELRTPLTSIRGFTQALLDGTVRDEPRRASSLAVIDDEARRMLRLVEDLMDLSRIQAGEFNLRPEPVDAAELLTHVAEIFRQRAAHKGIDLRVESAPDLPRAHCDYDRIVQVITNLVDNAIQYTAVGSVTLRAGPGDGSVVLIVEDTGEGIPAQELPQLFDRFFRGERSERRRGTGLGLAIAREIVRAQGGEIVATSDPGVGTTFQITLPTHIPSSPWQGGS